MQNAPSYPEGRVRVDPPSWARQLVVNDCARFEISPPKLKWWLDPSKAYEVGDLSDAVVGSHDAAWKGRPARITVYDGGDKVEAKIVTLHELAHHIQTEREGNTNHDDNFWRICWGLYLRHRIPLERAIYSEVAYMAGAERVLREMGIKLNKEAEVAIALGAATRRKRWLAVQIRRLKSRLGMTRREREEQELKRQVRVLQAKRRVEVQVVERKMPAYKRSVKKRK